MVDDVYELLKYKPYIDVDKDGYIERSNVDIRREIKDAVMNLPDDEASQEAKSIIRNLLLPCIRQSIWDTAFRKEYLLLFYGIDVLASDKTKEIIENIFKKVEHIPEPFFKEMPMLAQDVSGIGLDQFISKVENFIEKSGIEGLINLKNSFLGYGKLKVYAFTLAIATMFDGPQKAMYIKRTRGKIRKLVEKIGYNMDIIDYIRGVG